MNIDIYDEDYYEHGVETGKSGYSYYRWMPEMTMAMAMVIIDFLGIKRNETILDFGCAKGFLVKAFRLLGRNAWGLDISQYAIDNVDHYIKEFCHIQFNGQQPKRFNYCIAKDVFEHVPHDKIVQTLKDINSDFLFCIIPLGENGKYNAPANNLDITHIICESLHWWYGIFDKSDWIVRKVRHKIPGIKESYYKKYPESHGFFVLEKRRL